MKSSASAALTPAPAWNEPAASVPVLVSDAKIAFSSSMVSATTLKSVIVSRLVSALSSVSKRIVSLPAPPLRVSLPSPPLSVSLPLPPASSLAASLPVRLSLKLLPARFSTFFSVSMPEPPVACALPVHGLCAGLAALTLADHASIPPSLSSPASSISRVKSGIVTWRLPCNSITPSRFSALIWRLTVSSVRPR